MAKHIGKLGKRQIVLLCVAAVCLIGIVGTTAYLLSVPNSLPNTFVPATVTCAVEETFENNIKTDVSIRNTSNISAFIRAVPVINWVDDSGNVAPYTPQEGTGYTITFGKQGWVKGDDGFWYYQTAVDAGEKTADLIETVQPLSAPDGFHLSVRVMASAIQAAPAAAAQEAWGVSVNGTSLTP